MRVSIPGFDGLYFDTDAESPAVSIALTAAGRRAPKPQGYAVQLLPYLWSFDVDLREVPNEHPIQYLHPEGAQSLGELSADRTVRQMGTEFESVLRFVWEVNQEVESATNQLVGREPDRDGVVIEIDDGAVTADGEELETDEFDVEESAAGPGSAAGVGSRSVTEIEIEEGAPDRDSDDDPETGSPADLDDTADSVGSDAGIGDRSITEADVDEGDADDDREGSDASEDDPTDTS